MTINKIDKDTIVFPKNIDSEKLEQLRENARRTLYIIAKNCKKTDFECKFKLNSRSFGIKKIYFGADAMNSDNISYEFVEFIDYTHTDYKYKGFMENFKEWCTLDENFSNDDILFISTRLEEILSQVANAFENGIRFKSKDYNKIMSAIDKSNNVYSHKKDKVLYVNFSNQDN
jgi:hypothetical protein